MTLLALGLISLSGSNASAQILASTYNFTTALGTVQANGHIGGKATAATSLFDRTFFDAPLNDPEDPLGTARHELFHGIGFAAAYDLFSAHIRTVAGQRRFNITTNGTGNDLAVLTAASTHLQAADFTGQGVGGLEINQTCLLMTPQPTTGCAVPYPVDNLDRDLLNSAFAWGTTGGLQITVVFDNSLGTWTAAEMARINTAKADDAAVFGAANGTNQFTWTVLIAPEPSAVAMGICSAFGILWLVVVIPLRRKMRYRQLM